MTDQETAVCVILGMMLISWIYFIFERIAHNHTKKLLKAYKDGHKDIVDQLFECKEIRNMAFSKAREFEEKYNVYFNKYNILKDKLKELHDDN